jgi:hypothetical protein
MGWVSEIQSPTYHEQDNQTGNKYIFSHKDHEITFSVVASNKIIGPNVCGYSTVYSSGSIWRKGAHYI